MWYTPAGRFTLEVDHRLKVLATTVTDPTTRFYVLQYWDIWSYVMECLTQLAGASARPWNPEDCYFLEHMPAVVTSHPLPRYTVWHEHPRFVFTDSKLTGAEENLYPLVLVIQRVWQGQYTETNFSEKLIRAYRATHHDSSLGGWYIECLILTALGAYAPLQLPCLQWDIRRALCRWWRGRYMPHVYQADALTLCRDYSFELFLALREFVFFSVRDLPALEEWVSTRTAWAAYFARHLQVTDEYRRQLTPTLQSSWFSPSPMTETTPLKPKGLWMKNITQPRDFWDVQAHEKTIPAVWVAPPAHWTPAHDERVRRLGTEFFQRRHELAAYLPSAAEWRWAQQELQIPAFRLVSFLVNYRFLLALGLCVFQGNLVLTRLLMSLVISHYTGNADTEPLHWKALVEQSPLAARLLQLLLDSYRQSTEVQAYSLPFHWVSAQLDALQERFDAQQREIIQRCDYLLYCRVCRKVRSNVTQFRARGANKVRRFDATHSAGFFLVTVDTLTGKLYCNRKNGLKKSACRESELQRIPLIGKWLTLYGETYVICGQEGCGNIAQLDQLCAVEGVMVNAITPTGRGLQCAQCFLRGPKPPLPKHKKQRTEPDEKHTVKSTRASLKRVEDFELINAQRLHQRLGLSTVLAKR